MSEQTAGAGQNKQRPVFWVIMLLLVGAFCFGTVKIGVRLLAAKQGGAAARTSPVEYVNRDGFYTYPPISKSSFENEYGSDIPIQTDGLGFRNPKNSHASANTIILGDSFIMAINTEESQTLAARLREKGLTVYNAGMDGFSTFQEQAALAWLVENIKVTPKIVIVGFYLGNDFHDNYCQGNPACATGGRRDRIKTLLGHAPSNIMASYPLSEMASFANSYGPEMREAAGRTAQSIAAMAEMSRKRNFRLVLAGIPSKAQAMRSFYEMSNFSVEPRAEKYALGLIRSGFSFDNPDKALAAIAASNNVQYISLLKEFRAHDAPGLYFGIDHHWNPAGQQLAADIIFSQLGEAAPGK